MGKLAPAESGAWQNPDQIIARDDGHLSRKCRELIALAVAHAIQCPYCIEAYTKGARTAGASRKEIVEAFFLTVAAARRGDTRDSDS